MKKAFAVPCLCAAILVSLARHVHAQSQSNSLSCPPNYALSIDPPPPPKDDPATSDMPKPLTAVEKQQAEQLAKADEMSRWHCVPMDSIRPVRPESQQPSEDSTYRSSND